MFANVINQFVGEVTRRPREAPPRRVESWEHLRRYGAPSSRVARFRWRRNMAALLTARTPELCGEEE